MTAETRFKATSLALSFLVCVSLTFLCQSLPAQQEKSNRPSTKRSKGKAKSDQPPVQTNQESSGSMNRPTSNQSKPTNSAPDIEPVKRIWRVGASIRGGGSAATNIKVTFPVPTDWPEQHVNLYKENIPPETRSANFRMSDGVRQMVATIPRLERGVQIDINVLMEITVKGVAYPERTDHLVIPKRPPRDIRLHLNPSPLIESRDRNVRKKVKELVDKNLSPWEQARAFYDFVTNEIEMDKKSKVLGAKKALKESKGAIEDRTNVFIALCRSHKIPARTVWADDGEYAEFYLQDDTGEGRWYPVVLEGQTEFGSMSNPRVIFQKGDNHKIPESRERLVYVTEFISGRGKLQSVRWKQDVLPPRER